MQVAIIDIGSNTARLLVAEVTPDGRSSRSRRRAFISRSGRSSPAESS